MNIQKFLALIGIGLLLLPTPSYAAINAATQWNVRTDGADTNGCAFRAGGSGTDRSLQASPDDSGTDLVVDAVDNTIVTSATHNFVAADVNNHINISAGAGYTTGIYEIISVAANAATLDRSPAAVGTTGGTWALGGACLTMTFVDGLVVAGNTVNVKGGTYTSATTLGVWTATGTAADPIKIRGYTTTPDDGVGTAAAWTGPLVTSATNSTALFTINNADFTTIDGFKFTHTAATRGICVSAVTSSSSPFRVINSVFDGCSVAINGSTILTFLTVGNSFITNSTTNAISIGGAASVITLVDSIFYNNTGSGITSSHASTTITALNNVFSTNTFGIKNTSAGTSNYLWIKNNSFVSNTDSGVSLDGTTAERVLLENNIFYGNTTNGISFATNANGVVMSNKNNAYGGNGTNRTNIAVGTNDVTLTGSPFVSSTNWALNSTAGAGAACKSVGFPGTMLDGVTIGYLDIGAVQSQSSGGGTRVY